MTTKALLQKLVDQRLVTRYGWFARFDFVVRMDKRFFVN